MQKTNTCVKVAWDSSADEREQTYWIKPQFPNYIFPIQKCNKYGAMPPHIPVFYDKDTNTWMLWILVGILSRVEELWFLVSQVYLKQSLWHGWILTYISKKILTHCNSLASSKDPFKIPYMRNVSSLMKKIVSSIFI